MKKLISQGGEQPGQGVLLESILQDPVNGEPALGHGPKTLLLQQRQALELHLTRKDPKLTQQNERFTTFTSNIND